MESLILAFQFQKIDPYDWFCGPGSHLLILLLFIIILHYTCQTKVKSKNVQYIYVTDLFVLLPHQAQRTPSPGLTWALIEHTCTSLASNHPSST